MKPPLILTAVLLVTAAIPPALAQEGLATSSTIGGRNTVQQAPSGGSTDRTMAHAPTDDGRPTPDDRRQEQQDNAASQICKGC